MTWPTESETTPIPIGKSGSDIGSQRLWNHSAGLAMM
jgi:hypothetical protein